jgi:hypothetical protein
MPLTPRSMQAVLWAQGALPMPAEAGGAGGAGGAGASASASSRLAETLASARIDAGIRAAIAASSPRAAAALVHYPSLPAPSLPT